MTTFSLRAALAAAATTTAALLVSPLTASAGVMAHVGEGPSDATTAWHLLGALAPVALWGLPLAYVVFTVVSVLPRHPGAQERLAEPRDATFLDRLSLGTDPGEGW
jgi:hypothetical protein